MEPSQKENQRWDIVGTLVIGNVDDGSANWNVFVVYKLRPVE